MIKHPKFYWKVLEPLLFLGFSLSLSLNFLQWASMSTSFHFHLSIHLPQIIKRQCSRTTHHRITHSAVHPVPSNTSNSISIDINISYDDIKIMIITKGRRISKFVNVLVLLLHVDTSVYNFHYFIYFNANGFYVQIILYVYKCAQFHFSV